MWPKKQGFSITFLFSTHVIFLILFSLHLTGMFRLIKREMIQTDNADNSILDTLILAEEDGSDVMTDGVRKALDFWRGSRWGFVKENGSVRGIPADLRSCNCVIALFER